MGIKKLCKIHLYIYTHTNTYKCIYICMCIFGSSLESFAVLLERTAPARRHRRASLTVAPFSTRANVHFRSSVRGEFKLALDHCRNLTKKWPNSFIRVRRGRRHCQYESIVCVSIIIKLWRRKTTNINRFDSKNKRERKRWNRNAQWDKLKQILTVNSPTVKAQIILWNRSSP